ncbi:PREDICTED: protein asteroid homolog 1 [Elephantulus edwardii]|uniref:protein asteroid homolog 1 n=1 Tax=Elephantulus edwardii TaxID=28737 RepID=UPI0003F0BBB6|nr:PREDICTED: protein asteroid homolog 1 [Elephantulus edwardii]
MGIRGLMSFVEDHRKELLRDVKLRDTRLVIDGYALFHWLSFHSDLELRYGGDYDSFADVAREFFETLSACGICPYVVLDGGCDISDKKLCTLKDRARERILAARALSLGGTGRVCPLLTREAFLQVLTEQQVGFVQSFSEADQDIVTLANHWSCPVLSSDSDFCIFDLKAGFCLLSGFQWRNISTVRGTQSCFIPAACFSVDTLCQHFNGMTKALLPLFAVLCGNDYGSLSAGDSILAKIRPPPGAASPSGRQHRRVLGLLSWLSSFPGPAEAVDRALQLLPRCDRERVREGLSSAVRDYQPSQARPQDLLQRKAHVCPDAMHTSLPGWVRLSLARGQLSPFISDALVLRRTILHTQVEDLQRPSAHRASLPLRQAIYGLLWGAIHPQGTASPPTLGEVERVSRTIRTATVHATELPGGGAHLSTLPELPVDQRETLLLEALQVNRSILDAVPPALRLPVAVSCFWVQQVEVRVTLVQAQALLMGMLMGPLHIMVDSKGEDAVQVPGAQRLKEELLSVKARTRMSGWLDVASAHTFCQWQSCMQMGLYLNQLLSTPLAEPDLTRLYSGSLVHGLCRELTASSTDRLLSLCPEAKQLYGHLFCALQSSAPPEFSSPKGKSRSKKKKKGTKNRGRATSSTGCQYEGGNRFKVLMVENLEEMTEASQLK